MLIEFGSVSSAMCFTLFQIHTTMRRYYLSLGACMVVTLVSVVLMMCTISLPCWYHSEQHPRTDIGLFYNCSTEGLSKSCRVFTDNEGMKYHYYQFSTKIDRELIILTFSTF